MGINYDKDFEKVMTELQTNFEWGNVEDLPEIYKDLLNDTIKATKLWFLNHFSCCSCGAPPKNIEQAIKGLRKKTKQKL